MRRLVATIMLGAGGWIPAPAPNCPLAAAGGAAAMEAAPTGPARASEATAAHRHGEASAVADEGHEHEPRPPDGKTCPRGSPCGASMVGTRLPARAAPAPIQAVADTVVRASFSSVPPTRDPPPPRLPV